MDGIAHAHRDSLETLCSGHYPADLIAECILPITANRYRNAKSQGATIFVAEGDDGTVLGFSEVHRVKGGEFNAAVFVSGSAARQGIGTALYQAAESYAAKAGASKIALNSSLAGIEFYRSMGFKDVENRELAMDSGLKFKVLHMSKGLLHTARARRPHGDGRSHLDGE